MHARALSVLGLLRPVVVCRLGDPVHARRVGHREGGVRYLPLSPGAEGNGAVAGAIAWIRTALRRIQCSAAGAIRPSVLEDGGVDAAQGSGDVDRDAGSGDVAGGGISGNADRDTHDREPDDGTAAESYFGDTDGGVRRRHRAF